MISSVPIVTATGTGSSVSYTVPTGQGWTVNASNFCNTTGGSLAVTIKANDGTADREIEVKSVSANSSYQSPAMQGLALSAGDILKINAAVGIDIWVSAIIAS